MKLFFASLGLIQVLTTIPLQLPPRELNHTEVTVTFADSVGNLFYHTLNQEEFENYKKAPVQPYYPSKDGFFTSVSSIVDPHWSFPVHFQYSRTTEIAAKPVNQRILVITLHGLGGRASDLGAFATALRPYADIMPIGTLLDKNPFAQDKAPLNFKQGSFENFLADPQSARWGGGFRRLIEEPVDDITTLLEGGVTFTQPDGTQCTIRPYDYGAIIAVGLCVGSMTLIKVQEKLLTAGKRGFDGFIMDSPLADFKSAIPFQWASRKNFGPAYNLTPVLKNLCALGKPPVLYIMRGGQDKLCTERSALAVLDASNRSKSLIVTTQPMGHARCMYNDTGDKNSPDGTPYQHINGSRQVQTGLMQEWVQQNFLPQQ